MERTIGLIGQYVLVICACGKFHNNVDYASFSGTGETYIVELRGRPGPPAFQYG